MNPWLLEEGASGSSAGPGAATAAALVSLSIGSETGGSIVSPAMRCDATGLRPTFGRVPQTGAMTLCWSLDKLGPITGTVEGAMLVLRAISGPDAGDASSVPSRLNFDATAPVVGLKVDYIAEWMRESPATDVDRAAMKTMKKLRMQLKEVTLPKRLLQYFLDNESRLGYDQALKSHLPIGSGAVESAARHTVQERLKQSGMRW